MLGHSSFLAVLGHSSFLAVAIMSLSTLANHNRKRPAPEQSTTLADAAKALQRYRGQGYNMFDDKDAQQCRLYLQMRLTNPRASAEKFLRFMKDAKQDITMGAQAETKYWGVPKHNFPHGPPEDIASAIVDENTLAEMEAQSGDLKIDTNAYFVVDKVIDRHRLGMGVVTLKFYTGGTTTASLASLSDKHDSDPHAASSGGLSRAAAAGALPMAAPQCLPALTSGALPTAAPSPSPKRTHRQISDPPSPKEDPAMKRRNMLSATMTELRDNLKDAAELDHWLHLSDWDQTSVAYYTTDLLQVLEKLIEEYERRGDGGKAKPLIENALNFFCRLFTRRRCFVQLGSFRDAFQKFATMGAEPTGEFVLLEALARHPQKPPQAFDMSNVDVVARRQFAQTPLYFSFLCHNCNTWIGEAKEKLREESPDFQEVGRCLDNALKIKPVDEGLRQTAENAKYLFCSDDDNFDKMEWVSKHASQHYRFLSSWAPHLPITTAVNMVQESPNLQGQSFERFYAAAQFLNNSEVAVDNNVAQSALNLVHDIHALCGGPPPKTNGLYHYMAWMVSVRMSTTVQEDFDLLAWAEHSLIEINVIRLDQAHKNFFKTVPKKTSLPEPLSAFVTKFRAIMEQRRADKEAKAALPTAAAEGALPTTDGDEALPAAAPPVESQLLTHDKEKAALIEKFNTDPSFRALVMESLKTLSERCGSAIQVDEFCEKPGCMPLKILFAAALQHQDDDEKMLSAQIMWKILMGFTTEADACKPKPSGALPSAATKKAAALPSAAAIREGDIVYGKATKFKDRFDGVKCKVIAIQAQHYKVEILEGPAAGQKHRYLHASVSKKDDSGASPVAAPAGAVVDQHLAAATQLPDTLPATLDESGDSLANIFSDLGS